MFNNLLLDVLHWVCCDGIGTMGNRTEIRASQFTLSLLLLDVSVPWVYTHLFVPKREIAQNIQNLVASSRLRAGLGIQACLHRGSVDPR